MSSVIVADASCLIGLDNINRLPILAKLYTEILLPPAVSMEFGNPISFARIVVPSDKDLVRSLSILLGAGESEAIALAIEKKVQVILDDKKARGIAEEMGLMPIGTVGILLKAKIANHISSLTEDIG
jgi:predicted nucleic acid-binding protein